MPFYTSLNLQPIPTPDDCQLPNIINVLVYISADSGFGTDIDTNKSSSGGKKAAGNEVFGCNAGALKLFSGL
jgi:hypothetical protein